MSAIGPGSIVQRLDDGRWFTKDALYRVEALGGAGWCKIHGDFPRSLIIREVPFHTLSVGDGWCPHHFRPWPPPADETLRDEEAPTDERVTA